MALFEITVSLNISRTAFVEHVHKELVTEEAAQFSISNLESRREILESYCEDFELTHQKLVAGSGKIEDVLEIPYSKDKYFDITIGHYHAARSILNQLINKRGISSTSRHSVRPGSAQSMYSKRYLSEISLLKFSGKYADWRSFRDLLPSLVGSNPNLSNVEKMHYLRTSLSNKPAQIISNLTMSGGPFSTAWELLLTRYENKRLLISAHLKQLLNPPSIIHTIAQQFSSKLPVAWEVKVGSFNDYPNYTDFKEFLTGRARAMETIKINSLARAPAVKAQSSSSKSFQIHVKSTGTARVNTVTTQSSRQARPAPAKSTTGNLLATYRCSACEGDDYLSYCVLFKALTLPGRREVVERHYLCFNCLGRHEVKDCRSRRNCQICGGHHHSLLHPISSSQPQRTTPANQQTQTFALSSPSRKNVPAIMYTYSDDSAQTVSVTPTTSDRSSAAQNAVLCAVHQTDLEAPQDFRPGVLLATSIALLVCPEQPAHQVYLLIDSGSEVFIISDQIVCQLGAICG